MGALPRVPPPMAFWGHAFGDLGGQVAGVELRDRGNDPVQQHPRGVSSMFYVAETSRTPAC